MVHGSSWDRHLGGRLPGRGVAACGCRAHLAGGAARRREGLWHLPRHGGQRLRAAQDVRAHGRRALASACPPLRRSRTRAGRAARNEPRATALFALDRRRRRRDLRGRLPRRDARAIRCWTECGPLIEFRPMVADDLRLLHDWLSVRTRFAGTAITGRTRTWSRTTCPRSRAAIPPITTSSCSTERPSAWSRRTSSPTIRTTPVVGIDVTDAGFGRSRHRHRRRGAHRQGVGHRDPAPVRRRDRLRAARDDVLRGRSRSSEHRVGACIREGGLPRGEDVRRPEDGQTHALVRRDR